jgi:hypothetical protein
MSKTSTDAANTATFSIPRRRALHPAAARVIFAAAHESGYGRFCCKTLFAPVIKNFPGRRRDFRIKMWGASSPDDKLTGDLPNEIETTHISGFRSDRVIAGKLAPGSFGLLQQYRHSRDCQPDPRRVCLQRRCGSASGLCRTAAFGSGRLRLAQHVGCSWLELFRAVSLALH